MLCRPLRGLGNIWGALTPGLRPGLHSAACFAGSSDRLSFTNLIARRLTANMRARRDILVGPAGWSYVDWRGRVYPESAGTKFDTLALVAKYFDTAEINSSFYHPPAPETARSWLRRIESNPNFVFTAKLFRAFTHERGKATAEDERLFREGIDPLMQAGKLG